MSKRTFLEQKWKLAQVLMIKHLVFKTTQQRHNRVQIRRDDESDRDYIIERSLYIYNGEKYIVANSRFPNYNFSIARAGDYLFAVTHPLAVVGVAAALPLVIEGSEVPLESMKAKTEEEESPAPAQAPAQEKKESASTDAEDLEEDAGKDCSAEAFPTKLFSEREETALTELKDDKAKELWKRRAVLIKTAYFKAIGNPTGDLQSVEEDMWTPGEGWEKEKATSERCNLRIQNFVNRKYRCEVHDFKGHQLVTCLAPPADILDKEPEFKDTQQSRFPSIDEWDHVIEKPEPAFVEARIPLFIPEKYLDDYKRVRDGTHAGDKLRINTEKPAFKPGDLAF